MTNTNTSTNKKKILDVVDDFKPRQMSVIVGALVGIVFLAGICACTIALCDIKIAKDVFLNFIQLCSTVAGGILGIAIPGVRRTANKIKDKINKT